MPASPDRGHTLEVLESWCSSPTHFGSPQQGPGKPIPKPTPPPASEAATAPRLQGAPQGTINRTTTLQHRSQHTPTISRPGGGTPVSSHQHQRPPAAAHAAVSQHFNPLQHSLDLLMNHYLGMVPGRQPSAFEQPKGVNQLFVKAICRPCYVDVHQVVKVIMRASPCLAQVVVMISFALVPAWLWAVRATLARGQDHWPAALLWALLGLVVFLGSDALVQATARAAASDGVLVTAATLQLQPPAQQAAPSVPPSKPNAAPLATPSAAGTSAATKPAADPGSSSQRSTQQAPAPAPKPPAAVTPAPGTTRGGSTSGWSEVRRMVIALEFDVFGNELTEGVLPADVLPGRVQKLCEEVHVAYPAVAVTPQSLLEALVLVQQKLGT